MLYFLFYTLSPLMISIRSENVPCKFSVKFYTYVPPYVLKFETNRLGNIELNCYLTSWLTLTLEISSFIIGVDKSLSLLGTIHDVTIWDWVSFLLGITTNGGLIYKIVLIKICFLICHLNWYETLSWIYIRQLLMPVDFSVR